MEIDRFKKKELVQTSVSVEKELYDWAKKEGIMFSKVLNDTLRQYKEGDE